MWKSVGSSRLISKLKSLTTTKVSVMLGFALAFMFTISVVYTNCGRAQLGSIAQNSNDTNGAQSILVGVGACAVGQVAIGIHPDKTLICVANQNSNQATCPVDSSLFEVVNNVAYCVPNTSWDVPGSVCPVGRYLLSYSNSGAILCTGPQMPGPTPVTPGPTPVTPTPTPTPITLTCPAGKYVSGIVDNQVLCTDLPATMPSGFVCPTGQFLADLTVTNGSSTPVCRDVPWNSNPAASAPGAMCGDGSHLIGYLGANILCAKNSYLPEQTGACTDKKVLIHFDANGKAVCSDLPNPDLSNSCPAGSKATGVKNGRVVCEMKTATDTAFCSAGQFVVKVEAGIASCADLPVNSMTGTCPISSYPIGISNGAQVCVPVPKEMLTPNQICIPNTEVSCSVIGGIGSKTCSSNGLSHSSCRAVSCSPGYVLEDGSCKATACIPGTNQACQIANGAGQQFCGAGGAWTPCQVTSCDANYRNSNNQCVIQACTPGSIQACTEGLGFGSQICSVTGSGHSACIITSCQNGYTLKQGVCVDTSAPRITFTTVPNSTVMGNSATLVYAVVDNEGGVAGVSCELDSATFSPCESPVNFRNLSPGAHVFKLTAIDKSGNSSVKTTKWSNNSCTPGSVGQCSVPNGAGSKLCSADGLYGNCNPQSCTDGYELQPGGCVALQCGAGFSVVGNKCVDNLNPVLTIEEKPQHPTIGSSAVLKFTAVDQGSGVEKIACRLDNKEPAVCVSPLELRDVPVGAHVMEIVAIDRVGNKDQKKVEWSQYRCVPGAMAACKIVNGSGQQVCAVDGSAFGACAAKECDAGYSVSGGQCTDQTSPTLTITKRPDAKSVVTKVEIAFTASDTGSGLASVTCALDKESAKACSNAVTYVNLTAGSHAVKIVAKDKSGNEAVQTITWLVQSCAPNSVKACSISNGAGQMICSASGESYGACSAVSCQPGFLKSGAGCAVNAEVPIHRFFGRNGEHFYTKNQSEGLGISGFYRYEGVGFSVFKEKTPETQTLYRCLQNNGRHFVSTSSNCEKNPNTVNEGAYGEIYKAAGAGLVPLYRYFAPAGTPAAGDHLTTISPQTEFIAANGYKSEGVLGYVPKKK